MTRRKPAEYNWSKLQFDQTILTKHFTAPRRKKIAFVVVHHMTIVGKGDGKANDACYQVWQSRPASAHYGVDGKFVRQFVWDGNAAWSTGNSTGNHAGISIEHANSASGPTWTISDETWKTGAKLAAHLHYVYKLGRPTSKKGGRSGTLRKHSSFTSTACPGPYMDKIWDRYVEEAQRVYDLLSTVAQTVRWFEHKHLNTWGDDGDKGTASFKERLPRMVVDLTATSPEVITLNEVRPAQVPAWRVALDTAGYMVVVADGGNLIAAKNSAVTLGSTYSTPLPAKVQGAGRKEVVTFAHLRVNGVWVVVAAAHLEFRSGAKWDAIRVDQAKSVIRETQKFAIRRGLPFWRERSSIGIDENSTSWVRDKAFLPAKYKPMVKAGIDAIYSRRPSRSTSVEKTASDHPIVGVVYGRKL